MLQRIREACRQGNFKLSNVVDADETYIGGKEGNKHNLIEAMYPDVARTSSAVSPRPFIAPHCAAFPSSAGSTTSKPPSQIRSSPVNWPVRIAAMP